MGLLTIAQAAKKLGVHANSLRNYEKRGLIKPGRLPGGQRRYSTDEVARLLSSGEIFGQEGKSATLCARASTKKQADSGNLERQMLRLRQFAKDKGFTVGHEVSDVGG